MSLPELWKTGQDPCTNRVKIALHKLFAGILVQLCSPAGVGGKVTDEQNRPNYSYHFIFHHKNSTKYKHILEYQPTWGKLWPT